MKCIECDRMGYPISCNPPIENLLDILLDVTKLPLELCIKIDLYYEHSKVANYYKENHYMCFNNHGISFYLSIFYPFIFTLLWQTKIIQGIL